MYVAKYILTISLTMQCFSIKDKILMHLFKNMFINSFIMEKCANSSTLVIESLQIFFC